jgi:hypothetical protein
MGLKIAAAVALAALASAETRPRLRKPVNGRYNSAGGRKSGAGVINVHLVPHSHDGEGGCGVVDGQLKLLGYG